MTKGQSMHHSKQHALRSVHTRTICMWKEPRQATVFRKGVVKGSQSALLLTKLFKHKKGRCALA